MFETIALSLAILFVVGGMLMTHFSSHQRFANEAKLTAHYKRAAEEWEAVAKRALTAAENANGAANTANEVSEQWQRTAEKAVAAMHRSIH